MAQALALELRASAAGGMRQFDGRGCQRAGIAAGEVEDIVLDKLSNNIMFAIVGFARVGAEVAGYRMGWMVVAWDQTTCQVPSRCS